MKIKCSRLLKNVLSTTSIVALSSSFLSGALAANRTTQNVISSISTAGDWSPSGFNSGDSIIFGGNHSVNATGLGSFDIGYINSGIDPAIGKILINTSNLRIGGVIGSFGIQLTMDTGGQAILATLGVLAPANNYSGLKVVDFNGIVGSTLTINNTVPISLPTSFLSTGGSAGSIIIDNNNIVTFNGSFSNVSGTLLEGITINSGSTGIFNSDVSVSDVITVASGIAEFGSGVTINALDIAEQNNSGSGVIIFHGDAIVNSSIGNSFAINRVDIENGEVDFRQDALTAGDTNFTNVNSSLKLSGFGPKIVVSSNFNNTSGFNGVGVVRVLKATDLLGSLGGVGAGFDNVNFEVNERFRIFNNQIYVNTITTNVNGQGVLLIVSDNDKDIRSDIGTVTEKLNLIIPTVNVTERGSPSVSTTKTTLKSGHSIYANEFRLYDENEVNYSPLNSSIFVMEDDTFIDALITTTPFVPPVFCGDGFGVRHSEVDILSNATIVQDIGTTSRKMNDIKFLGAAGSIVNLSGSLYSDNITSSSTNIVLGKDVDFDGQTIADSTTISLKNNTLSFDNASSSKFIGTPKVNFTVDDTKYGHFVVLGGNLDLNDALLTAMNLTLTDIAAILPPPGPIGQSYVIFGDVSEIIEVPASISIFDNSKVIFIVAQQNPFVTWSYDNGVVKRVRLPQDQIDEIIRGRVVSGGGSSTTVENALRIANPNNVGDAASLFQNLVSIDQDLVRSLNALQPVIVEASEQISEAVGALLSTIGNRLKSLGVKAFFVAQSDSTNGIAAGDEDYKHGVWSSLFYGTVTQKARGESPGFRNRTVGFVVGVDTKISEDRTVGVAFSYADNNVKHKDSNNGDTSKVKAYTISAYGSQELSEKWFVQAVGNFSRNKINNREQRFFQGITEIARGDFYTNAYGLSVLAGHNNLITDNLVMVTTVGTEYLILANSKYKEKGTINQNLTVRKETDHKLNAIIGTSFAYDVDFYNHKIIPEVHGSVSYDLLNKSPKITVLLDGLFNDMLEKKTAETERVLYNLGTSLSTIRGAAEFSAGYDIYLAKKYTGHQGTLKARLNF